VNFAPQDCPKLRWPLETEQVEHDGNTYLVLRDQYGIAEEPALIPAPCVPLVARFDGTNSIAGIAQEASHVGATEEFVIKLARDLDALGYLETEVTRQKFSELKDSYLRLSVRPPALADRVYPSDPGSLRESIAEYMSGREDRYEYKPTDGDITGFMAPHIDYRRGWKTYGAAAAALASVKRPDVIFLLGTSHFGGESLFQLSRMDFSSPLGILPAAREVIEEIAGRYGRDRAFQDEFLHKREHSLELQLPFLSHRFESEAPPAIVPVLVGSFHHFLEGLETPAENGEVTDFVGALSDSVKKLRAQGKRVLFYGGVDLAHVGKHFGDNRRWSENVDEIERRDRELLNALLAADETKLFHHIAEDKDKRRICGFPSLYTMFAAARRAGLPMRGHLVEYRQAVDSASDCIVTFAGAVWTSPTQ